MKWLNLPNKLTISRIFVVPIIVFFISLESPFWCFLGALLFVAAAVTDLFDGYLARRDNQVTSLGKFLDPLADKVLISSVLVMLVQMGWVNAWVAIIVICRDMMVTGLRAIAAEDGIVISADKYGKFKTIMQISALVPLTLHYPFWGIPVALIGSILLYVALLLTIFSGINYFFAFFRDLQEKEKKGNWMIMGKGMLDSSSLVIRLRNCLTTILELEEELSNSDLGGLLQEEFETLKGVLVELHSIKVHEEEVRKIELATVRFLEEVKGVLKEHKPYNSAPRILQ